MRICRFALEMKKGGESTSQGMQDRPCAIIYAVWKASTIMNLPTFLLPAAA